MKIASDFKLDLVHECRISYPSSSQVTNGVKHYSSSSSPISEGVSNRSAPVDVNADDVIERVGVVWLEGTYRLNGALNLKVGRFVAVLPLDTRDARNAFDELRKTHAQLVGRGGGVGA